MPGSHWPASLDAILSSLRTRYHGRDEVSIDATCRVGLRVAGNEPRLARAVVSSSSMRSAMPGQCDGAIARRGHGSLS
jgi:hypothetical protein